MPNNNDCLDLALVTVDKLVEYVKTTLESDSPYFQSRTSVSLVWNFFTLLNLDDYEVDEEGRTLDRQFMMENALCCNLDTVSFYKTRLHCFKKSADRVAVNVRSWIELLYIFGCVVDSFDIGRLFRKFWCLDLCGKMESYLKFQTASYFAKMLKQEKFASLPLSKEWEYEFFLVGRMNKFLRQNLFRRNIRFGWSVLQSKRGMSPLTGVQVCKNLHDHAALLSLIEKSPESSCWEVQRTAAELMGGGLNEKFDFIPTAPSTAACFEFNRTQQMSISYKWSLLPPTEGTSAISSPSTTLLCIRRRAVPSFHTE